MNEEMTKSEEQHLSLQKALQQCELVQNMIDISISSLEGLRTKCATSNDLTQKEIRTLEVSARSSWMTESVHLHLSQSKRAVAVCCSFLGHGAYSPVPIARTRFLLSVLSLHKYARISAKAPWLYVVLCSAVNQEAPGLQRAVVDLRILQVAAREGGSSPSQSYLRPI